MEKKLNFFKRNIIKYLLNQILDLQIISNKKEIIFYHSIKYKNYYLKIEKYTIFHFLKYFLFFLKKIFL